MQEDVEAPAATRRGQRASLRNAAQGQTPHVVGKPSKDDAPAQCDIDGGDTEDVVTIAVIRSPIWSGGDEEVMKVEVKANGTLRDLKRRIFKLSTVPADVQRFQRTGAVGEDSLPDSASVRKFVNQPIHLLPNPSGIEAHMDPEVRDMLHSERALDSELQKQYEHQAAFEQSMEDTSYQINFVHAFAVGSSEGQKLKERQITLDVDALKLVADVTAMAEIEFFGVAGREPVALVHDGRLLPPDMPIYYAGLADGDTINVVTQDDMAAGSESEDSDDSLNAGMMAWAAS